MEEWLLGGTALLLAKPVEKTQAGRLQGKIMLCLTDAQRGSRVA